MGLKCLISSGADAELFGGEDVDAKSSSSESTSNDQNYLANSQQRMKCAEEEEEKEEAVTSEGSGRIESSIGLLGNKHTTTKKPASSTVFLLSKLHETRTLKRDTYLKNAAEKLPKKDDEVLLSVFELVKYFKAIGEDYTNQPSINAQYSRFLVKYPFPQLCQRLEG